MAKDFLITLGTGPAGPILGQGKNRRLQTSTFIYLNKTALLFDTGPSFLKQIKYVENQSPSPLAGEGGVRGRVHTFFSHPHGDATFGAKDARDYFARQNITAVWHGHAKTLTALALSFRAKRGIPSKSAPTFIKLRNGQSVRLGKLAITPFLVRHVLGRRAREVPTFGYQINDGRKKIVIATDVSGIPSAAQKYFQNADLCLIDAAGWGRPVINHHDVLKFLEQSRGWDIKKIILTQVGRLVPPHDAANRYLRQHFPNASLAYDGMKMKLHGLTPVVSERIRPKAERNPAKQLTPLRS